MSWRSCGCCCCPCAIRDEDLADADAVTITEAFEHWNNEPLSGADGDISEQKLDDGSTLHWCKDAVTTEQTPCRRVQLSSHWAGQARYECSFVVSGLTGTNAGQLNDIYSGCHRFSQYVGNGSYAYLSIREVGGELQLKLRLNGVTIYTAPLASLPLADGSTLFTFVSSTEPNVTNWPATLSVTAASNATPVSNLAAWHRWYEETTFSPDGSAGPLLSVRLDARLTAPYSATATPTLALAMRQGDVTAHSNLGTPGAVWERNDAGGVDDRQCFWNLDYWTRWSVFTAAGVVWYAPDLSAGAEPITFGIALTRSAGAMADVIGEMLIDNVCLRIK